MYLTSLYLKALANKKRKYAPPAKKQKVCGQAQAEPQSDGKKQAEELDAEMNAATVKEERAAAEVAKLEWRNARKTLIIGISIS
jgi:hypothetical protein